MERDAVKPLLESSSRFVGLTTSGIPRTVYYRALSALYAGITKATHFFWMINQ
jgi:hypothetical protein